jgi:5-methylcytosine-specific restriction endonuclease McrA
VPEIQSGAVKVGDVISRDGSRCVWCGRVTWAGELTVEHLLPKTRGGRGIPENVALERLSGSESRPHAEYGSRQRALLARIAGSGSAENSRVPGETLGVKLG